MPAKRPPVGLGTRARGLWKGVLTVYDLTPAEMEVLTAACRLLDEIHHLEAAMEDKQLIVAGSAGQPRVHPALAELRAHRLALGRLLAQLDLPDEDSRSLPSPASLRGRKAARTRWDASAAIRGSRRRGA